MCSLDGRSISCRWCVFSFLLRSTRLPYPTNAENDTSSANLSHKTVNIGLILPSTVLTIFQSVALTSSPVIALNLTTETATYFAFSYWWAASDEQEGPLTSCIAREFAPPPDCSPLVDAWAPCQVSHQYLIALDDRTYTPLHLRLHLPRQMN